MSHEDNSIEHHKEKIKEIKFERKEKLEEMLLEEDEDIEMIAEAMIESFEKRIHKALEEVEEGHPFLGGADLLVIQADIVKVLAATNMKNKFKQELKRFEGIKERVEHMEEMAGSEKVMRAGERKLELAEEKIELAGEYFG